MSITGEQGRTDRVASISLIVAQAFFALILGTVPLAGLFDIDSAQSQLVVVLAPVLMSVIIVGSIFAVIVNEAREVASSRLCLLGMLGVIVVGAAGITVVSLS